MYAANPSDYPSAFELFNMTVGIFYETYSDRKIITYLRLNIYYPHRGIKIDFELKQASLIALILRILRMKSNHMQFRLMR